MKAAGSAVGQHRFAAGNRKELKRVLSVLHGGGTGEELRQIFDALEAGGFGDPLLKKRYRESHYARSVAEAYPSHPAATWITDTYAAKPKSEEGRMAERALIKAGKAASAASGGTPVVAARKLSPELTEHILGGLVAARHMQDYFVEAQKGVSLQQYGYPLLRTDKKFARAYWSAMDAAAEQAQPRQ